MNEDGPNGIFGIGLDDDFQNWMLFKLNDGRPLSDTQDKSKPIVLLGTFRADHDNDRGSYNGRIILFYKVEAQVPPTYIIKIINDIPTLMRITSIFSHTWLTHFRKGPIKFYQVLFHTTLLVKNTYAMCLLHNACLFFHR